MNRHLQGRPFSPPEEGDAGATNGFLPKGFSPGSMPLLTQTPTVENTEGKPRGSCFCFTDVVSICTPRPIDSIKVLKATCKHKVSMLCWHLTRHARNGLYALWRYTWHIDHVIMGKRNRVNSTTGWLLAIALVLGINRHKMMCSR